MPQNDNKSPSFAASLAARAAFGASVLTGAAALPNLSCTHIATTAPALKTPESTAENKAEAELIFFNIVKAASSPENKKAFVAFLNEHKNPAVLRMAVDRFNAQVDAAIIKDGAASVVSVERGDEKYSVSIFAGKKYDINSAVGIEISDELNEAFGLVAHRAQGGLRQFYIFSPATDDYSRIYYETLALINIAESWAFQPKREEVIDAARQEYLSYALSHFSREALQDADGRIKQDIHNRRNKEIVLRTGMNWQKNCRGSAVGHPDSQQTQDALNDLQRAIDLKKPADEIFYRFAVLAENPTRQTDALFSKYDESTLKLATQAIHIWLAEDRPIKIKNPDKDSEFIILEPNQASTIRAFNRLAEMVNVQRLPFPKNDTPATERAR